MNTPSGLSIFSGPAARVPHISKSADFDMWVMPLLASPEKIDRFR